MVPHEFLDCFFYFCECLTLKSVILHAESWLAFSFLEYLSYVIPFTCGLKHCKKKQADGNLIFLLL